MGLAEPRKRLKIAHNPNNVAWAQSTDSYGHRLMLSQGWKTGEGLGAKDAKRVRSQDDGRVTVTYKDDVLGLGAKLKGMDVEQSRAGLDAFQGLLGRLNGKSDAELEKEEKKVEDRKLAMWAQGKWGGMMFVPGGLLVQRDPFKSNGGGDLEEGGGSEAEESSAVKVADDAEEGAAKAKAQRKDEKRRKKAEKAQQASETDESSDKQRRKEERRRKRATEKECSGMDSELSTKEDATRRQEQPDPALSKTQPPTTTTGSSKDMKRKKKSKHPEPDDNPSTALESPSPSLVTDHPSDEASAAPTQATPRNGRHILRGKNIQAKKLAFSDAKMLDEIFMRKA